LIRRLIGKKCGKNILVKQKAYIGKATGLVIGDNSQLGQNSRIGPSVSMGENVVMGPDVVIMTTAHAWVDPDVPIRLQGDVPIDPVIIGDDVWLGTRVIVMPGITIGKGAVVGAGSIVTKDVCEFAVMAGVPAKQIRWRKKSVE
jgi:maltose O-acetyltransferase